MRQAIKVKILLVFQLFLVLHVLGQKVQTIISGSHSDSSLYHISRISENEFWAGGEHGILKSIDTLGNVKTVNYPNSGLDILKIERIENFIYLITSNATIYRYNTESDEFIRKDFPSLKGKCFYDLVGLPDGQILVCGGTSGIAKGDKKIPRGFIAKLDKDLNSIDIVWKSYRKFVWSLVESPIDGVFAVEFNGLKSRIVSSTDLVHWKKQKKVNGLVHEIAMIDGDIWYSGSKSIRFRRTGIFGNGKERKSSLLKKTGCLWSIVKAKGNLFLSSYKGLLLVHNPLNRTTQTLAVANGFSLYDMESISDSKFLVVGHGKGLYLVTLD
ncbi:MAG TPA: hypothetical protein PL017_03460 [Tenuifilaceae bacterium]|nr:hypothetical protein [Tenuifilaceae bacterium]HPE17499.1 hypothetical protein [Tenuifilaceae bacterium]HPJ45130.1 hypothetical protein [Tenuifilaceae bacterium]HRX68049.1 hypothetical protein [Tenuifilaceae bacterium]